MWRQINLINWAGSNIASPKRKVKMAKVIFQDDKQLESARQKAKGAICYRKLKDGRVVASKLPVKKKTRKV